MSKTEGPSPSPVDAEIASGDPERILRAIESARREGDESAFGLLYETYYPAVRGFFTKRLDSVELALDLTQETFVRVHKGLKGYRGDAPFGAWLFRIARNVLRRYLSTKSVSELVNKSISLDTPAVRRAAENAAQPAAALASEAGYAQTLRAEQRKILRDAVAELPAQRRKCMVLWVYYELSYEQVATVMQLSLGTVKAHLAQAREQLGRLVASRPHRGSRSRNA